MFCGETIEDLGLRKLAVFGRICGEAFRGTLDGEKVIVKMKKITLDSLWKDEMKELFGLKKVGMTYFQKEKTFILKFHKNIGTLYSKPRFILPPDVARWFLKICLYDYTIQNGDRTSNNVLILDKHTLMPIDEAGRKRPVKEWSTCFPREVNVQILSALQALATTRAELWEALQVVRPDGLQEKLADFLARGPWKIPSLERKALMENVRTTSRDLRWLDHMFWHNKFIRYMR